MATRIEPYTASRLPAVRAFNGRLRASGVFTGFLLNEHPPAPPGVEPAAVRQEHFLAVNEDEVRGGFILQRQPLWIGGVEQAAANYQMPISEGLVNRAFSHVGPLMVRHALGESPLIFAVGMGSPDRPFPRLLKAMGWHVQKVPFLFRLLRPGQVLRELARAHSSPPWALAGRLAASSGLAWLGATMVQARLPTGRQAIFVETEPCERWEGWSDEIWRSVQSTCALATPRTCAVLDALYPPGDQRYLRFRFRCGANIVGWVVLLDTPMHDDQYFGNLRVGVLLDGVGRLEYLQAIVRAATELLAQRGVDLIVTNQAHHAWTRAVRRSGYLPGPSNYLLALSPKCRELLEPLSENLPRVHLTRGDGDGRIHLETVPRR
jgi:hypothetical protein